ncbi:NAD-dependent succinate-semialdehyde dehydrogenase [Citricoccus parietis]|uniref:NAD-dependent succinate-semialdehyde dehydrogenase n=1 Tax=Citricoccus parietis TaxID=592307 RepID=A0ABV5G3A5_9MICC
MCSVSDASSEEALAALDAAAEAQRTWGKSTGRQRYGILMSLMGIIQERRADLAAMMTMEAGKPVAESGAEIDLACSFIQYFAEEALRIEGSYQVNPNGGGRMIVTKRPVGTAVLITPWNFPMSMAARKIAPALAAGCTLVVKPAKETPLTMLAFAQMLQEAGLPDGVLNVVTTSTSSQTMEPVIRSGKARKLSFTGSTPVGIKLVEQAAANIMKMSMELGGNAPFIVFADADMDQAVEGLMATKMRGNGETCTAANRVYVHRSIIDEFTSRVVDRMRGFTLGHGLDPEVTLGPLINSKQLATVQDLIDDAVAKGARVSLGGERHGTTGHFLQPTVLTDLPEDARILREEIFGPVAPIIPFDTEAEVVDKANDTEFGLSSYVFTENLETALRVSESIDSGLVGLNQGSVSNAAAPFGGTKMSGLGREGGKEGLEEYLETKFIALRLDTTPRKGTA